MILFSYKKTNFFIVSITTLLLIVSCSPFVDEDSIDDNDFSNSTSSSATGSYFYVEGGGGSAAFTHKASIVIGQKTFTTAYYGNSLENVSDPFGNPTVVDDMLYLPDFTNDRVLGYNTVPSTDGQAADFNIASDTFGPQTVTVVNGKFFLTDWGKNRILIYNKRPISSSAKADIVVGQTSSTGTSAGLAINRLDSPESLFVVDNKLIVTDTGNNRVLIWDPIPTSYNADADIVLGQTGFDQNVTTPISASSLNSPTGVWSDGQYLVVLDAGNNRVLIWSSFPTAIGQGANVVLGQSDFTSNKINQDLADPSASTLSVEIDGGGLYANGSNGSQLFIADSGNNRILVWDNLYSLNDSTIDNNKAADGLIGQGAFYESGDNRGLTTDDNTLSNPTGVYQFDNKLIVTDTGNNRYLIFNSAP